LGKKLKIQQYLLQRIHFPSASICKKISARSTWLSRFRAHPVRAFLSPQPKSGPTALKRKDSTMKRLAIVTGILALAAPLAMAQYSTWASDPAHSEVDFSIRHGGVSNVHGRFGKVAKPPLCTTRRTSPSPP
jgi:hypothetical protein